MSFEQTFRGFPNGTRFCLIGSTTQFTLGAQYKHPLGTVVRECKVYHGKIKRWLYAQAHDDGTGRVSICNTAVDTVAFGPEKPFLTFLPDKPRDRYHDLPVGTQGIHGEGDRAKVVALNKDGYFALGETKFEWPKTPHHGLAKNKCGVILSIPGFMGVHDQVIARFGDGSHADGVGPSASKFFTEEW
jgi:hypothetical protein